MTEDYQPAFADRFQKVQKEAALFQGMISDLSIAIFQSILDFQAHRKIAGNMVEFGTYKGRSASVLLGNLHGDDILGLVDVAEYAEFDKLRNINPAFKFFHGKSENLASDPALNSFLGSGVRFAHHDASHSYDNVSTEMALVEPILSNGGVMVLDDFCNPAFMQVVAACFHHLSRDGCGIEMFLYGENKAYLCKSSDFDVYARYVLEHLLPELKSAGFHCALARTANASAYRAFSVTRKRKPEDPDLYGLQTYGDQFYRP